MSSRTLWRSHPRRWPSPGTGERIHPDRLPQFGMTQVRPTGIATRMRLRPNEAEAIYSMKFGRYRGDCRAPILNLSLAEGPPRMRQSAHSRFRATVHRGFGPRGATASPDLFGWRLLSQPCVEENPPAEFVSRPRNLSCYLHEVVSPDELCGEIALKNFR